MKASAVRRLRRVEELLNEGLESSYQIAERLAKEGVTVSARQVQRDINAVGEEWKAKIVGMRHVRQMKKVAAAEARNRELAAEWERSKKDKERQRSKEVGGLGEDGAGKRTEAEVAKEGRLADPAYLTEQRRNDEFIADILGLKEAAKHEHTGKDGGPIKAEVKVASPVELWARIFEVLDAQGTAGTPAEPSAGGDGAAVDAGPGN